MSKVVSKVEKSVWQLAEPLAQDFNLSIWDVRFVKEGPQRYLRIFIDKDTGVTINDCEKFNRAIDRPLDDLDPIDQSYCLEVSSPGVDRLLTRDIHFEKSIGKEILVTLIRPNENKEKEIKCVLKSYDGKNLVVEYKDKDITFDIKNIANVKLMCDNIL